METLLDLFKQLCEILLTRYGIESIRGICPAFDVLDNMCKDRSLDLFSLKDIPVDLFMEIRDQIRYDSIPIPNTPPTPYMLSLMDTLEKNLNRVDELVVNMIVAIEAHNESYQDGF